jgi:hypothetical protein
MTYLKDIKLCIDCAFYGNHSGQRDRCINPAATMINPVNGEETYPLCISQRTGISNKSCGSEAQFFILNKDALADRLQRRTEFEEACRDAPF